MQDDGNDKPINLQDKFLETGAADKLRNAKTGGPVLHPIVIYQRFIDELSRINMAFDAEAWLDASEYPYNVHTDTMDKTIQSREEARPFFEMVCKMIRSNKIDSFRRVADHAEFVDPSMIIGHHMTFLQTGGRNVVQPMASRMVIRNTTGAWRMISVTNAVANAQYPYELPEPSDGLLPMANIAARNEQMRTREAGTPTHLGIDEDETNPLTIYRAFIEAFSAANMAGDFGMWCAMHRDRVRKHTPDEDWTVDTPNERRAIFDAIAAEFRDSGADTHRRRAIFAEWIGPHRIRGKHISEMTRGGKKVRPEVDSQFIIDRKHGAWRLVDVTNSAPIADSSADAQRYKPAPVTAPPQPRQGAKVVAFPSATAAQTDALSIYQELLDQSVIGVNTGNFAEHRRLFHLPCAFHAEQLDTLITSDDDLRPYFDTLVRVRQSLGADTFQRIATRADFIDDGLIAGHHVARMLRDGKDMKTPIEARWLLRRIRGHWRILSIANGLVDHDFPLPGLGHDADGDHHARRASNQTPDTATGEAPARRTDKGETT